MACHKAFELVPNGLWRSFAEVEIVVDTIEAAICDVHASRTHIADEALQLWSKAVMLRSHNQQRR